MTIDSGECEREADAIASRLVKDQYLPPLHRIKMPKTTTSSARIRWLWALGYPVKDISKGLGIRYQQVRNIINTEPKRATREDMPPLKIELIEVEDIVDTFLGSELERTFQADRKQRSRKGKRALHAKSTPNDEDIGEDEIPEVLEELEEPEELEELEEPSDEEMLGEEDFDGD